MLFIHVCCYRRGMGALFRFPKQGIKGQMVLSSFLFRKLLYYHFVICYTGYIITFLLNTNICSFNKKNLKQQSFIYSGNLIINVFDPNQNLLLPFLDLKTL